MFEEAKEAIRKFANTMKETLEALSRSEKAPKRKRKRRIEKKLEKRNGYLHHNIFEYYP